MHPTGIGDDRRIEPPCQQPMAFFSGRKAMSKGNDKQRGPSRPYDRIAGKSIRKPPKALQDRWSVLFGFGPARPKDGGHRPH
jgi:hypothetical protein